MRTHHRPAGILRPMPLLRKNPTCPIHGCALTLSHHGKKTNLGHYWITVQGAPIRYCPQCHERGTDTSVEVEVEASNAFLRKLIRLYDGFEFPPELGKPRIRVDFNPGRAVPDSRPAVGQPLDLVTASPVAPVVGSAERPEELPETAAEFESFRPRQPRHRLDQLVLDAETLARIREAVNVMLSQDLLFGCWNLGSVARTGRRVALNFYGAPGTGKTLAAEAIAAMLDREILVISYAELESKYVGETPKNIRAAFRRATETGALLFFDEADSILGKRLTSVSQAADNSINVARSTTLIELDNFDGVVIFASNLVKNYDTAFLRRVLAHVEFRLPATEQRRQLWQGHCPVELPICDDVDFELLAQHSEHAAGGDIQNAVLLAASYASLRQGEEQVVAMADFKRAIAFILDGKRRILE
ncbi:MAG TPA: ATP-binding protein [Lamprocystis sp. (in: g-proteobacteria)]|nr:ATP-binding protein [Lamprocystis sp. (in: g-proteobacteria)]